MIYSAKEYLKVVLDKINSLKEKDINTFYGMSINFGSNYKQEINILRKELSDLGYHVETKTCKRKLTDVIVSW